MRPQSRVRVTVRGTVIGGDRPLVCLPLVGRTGREVVREAEELSALQSDLLEWRADGYDKVESIGDCLSVLKDIRTIIHEIPLIFTCRIDREGGLTAMSRKKRLALISGAVASGDIDLVDTELCNDAAFIEAVRRQAARFDVKLILSYHNFTNTPSQSFICSKLAEAQKAGADISKIAVMPKDYGDVLRLFGATYKARKEMIEGPIVAMSMGPEGVISRLAGCLFGSDITFAAGLEASAPGQIPIEELRRNMASLYNP